MRYQARARECEQYKERLATLEQGNKGLRAEFQALHKVGHSYVTKWLTGVKLKVRRSDSNQPTVLQCN